MASLSQINRVKHQFDTETLTRIINALVLSKLFYCSSIWAITDGCKYEHITPVLKQLQWLPPQGNPEF
jgi:hypothetical protein